MFLSVGGDYTPYRQFVNGSPRIKYPSLDKSDKTGRIILAKETLNYAGKSKNDIH
jgi:hypothetical protein